MELHAKYTLFAEGCRGSLSQELMQRFNLRDGVDPQKYGIGIKELWEVAPRQAPAGPRHAQPGLAARSDAPAAARSSITSTSASSRSASSSTSTTRIRICRRSTSSSASRRTRRSAPTFEGGKRLAYGARAINEGGLQSVPKLAFPGGALIGCAAGFVNLPRIKGSHNAMKTGMLAAEAAFAALSAGRAHDTLADLRRRAGASRGSTRICTRCATSSRASSGACGSASLHGGVHMWLNDLGPRRARAVDAAARRSPTTRRCEPAVEMPRDRRIRSTTAC